MRKIFAILKRDIIASKRDFLVLYIMIIPILMALLIEVATPSINNTTITIAMLKTDTTKHIEFMENYAKIELFDNYEKIEKRVLKRDDAVGIIPNGNKFDIILQGNEMESTETFAKLLNSLYELDVDVNDTNASFYNFNKTTAPVKKSLVLSLITLTIVLAGMLVALGIVEEKTDKTITAINVSTVKQNQFILGKSLLGSSVAMFSIIICLFITGFYNVNWFMLFLVGVSSLILTILVGFIQGVISNDVIEAASGVKMLMFPATLSIVGYEFFSDKWQWTLYWSPFYWAYKSNDMILSNVASIGIILLNSFFILTISIIAYLLMMPKIRKGLS